MKLSEPLLLGDIYKVGYELTRRHDAREKARDQFIEKINDNPTAQIEFPVPAEPEFTKGLKLDTLV